MASVDTSLTGPFGLPLSTDVDEIREEMHVQMRERFPGWQPLDTAIDTAIIACWATIASETRQAAIAKVRQVVLELVGLLFRHPRLEGTPASSTMTVTAIDVLGHTEPAGLSVYLGDVEMMTTAELVVEVGETTGTVEISTVEVGSAANGADGSLQIDALPWLASVDPVVLDAPLGGGTDVETDDELEERLSKLQQLLLVRVTQPEDFTVAATLNPAVGLAWTLNNYDPTDGLTKARHMCTIVADDDGEHLPDDVMAAIDASLLVVQNTIKHVIPPLYEEIPVEVWIRPEAGWDPDLVGGSAAEVLSFALSPRGWIAGWFGEDVNRPPNRKVHQNELIGEIHRSVEGCNYVDDLKIGDGSTAFATLPSAIHLPKPGPITVHVLDPDA